ncbi:MAG: carbohydrate binding family 9 domain-containing protein [Bacteroidetes bacterium]|nr:carbohydrate binding family 9 domain-containing protein [Bacteroidota bacterium]
MKAVFIGFVLALAISSFFGCTLYAILVEPRVVNISRSSSSITVDGLLDEPVWLTAEVTTDFWQRYPYDSSYSDLSTEVRVTYDDKFLYVGAVCHTKHQKDYVIESLRRDFKGTGNDAFYFIINPFNDRMSGYYFGTSPYGVQSEAIIQNGGASVSRYTVSTNPSWDNKWYVEVKQYEDRWVAEMSIPFSTLRYKEGVDQWRVNFCRNDYGHNEYSNWNHIPRNFSFSSLANTGIMTWDEAPKKPGSNISVIPYSKTGVAKNYEEGTPAQWLKGLGGDAKIGLTSSLNLDLTINPDFSQVEVDQQVTNLDRFEIYFPEKRQFFLENNDLFSEFGVRQARPFFSRRIGIAYDEELGKYVENPILLGARLSGKLNQDWKIGVLNMQTTQDSESATPSTNYSVATVHRRIFERSTLAAFLVNKDPIQALSGECDSCNFDTFNRVGGMDFNLASADNWWTGKVFYHHSFDEVKTKNSFSTGAELKYDNGNLSAEWTHQLVGDGYNAEVGYVRRTGYKSFTPQLKYTFYPKRMKFIIRHGPQLQLDQLHSDGFGKTDQEFTIRYTARFRNQSSVYLSLNKAYLQLTDPYDPSNSEGLEYEAGEEFNTWYLFVYYRSDSRKPLSLSVMSMVGGYFEGESYSVSSDLEYQFRPYVNLSLDATYNKVIQPVPYSSVDYWLLGPKLDITFTKDLYLATLVQYNSQRENLNINARFQWRYAPVSDFYLVYTDDYFTNTLAPRSRAVILKLTYWLNV